MTLTDRDRKILLFLVPVVVLVAYWFLLLSPKREDATKLGDELAQAESTRDDLVARAQTAAGAQTDFAADFAEVLRVGKAIPTTVDMPSLLVQLDKAAAGTGIGFNSIKAGQRTTAQPLPPAGSAGGGSAPPAAAGGSEAASAPGAAAESANEAAQTSEERSAASGGENASGAPDATGAATAGTAPGLDTVPLDFTFSGDFFELADFLHRLKRFVHVNQNKIVVNGRLMVVESFALKMKDFPTLEATMSAKVYLSPQSEGVTAGATPAGPGTAPTAPATSGASAPAPTPTAPPSQ